MLFRSRGKPSFLSEPGTSKRTIGLLVGAFVVLNVVVIVVFTLADRNQPRRPPEISSQTPERATLAPVLPIPTAVAMASVVASPSTSTGRRRLLPTDPDPVFAQPYGSAPAANYGDAFESWNGKPSEVRTLTKVGEMRVGVSRKSEVKNEATVTAILTRLANELEPLERVPHRDHEERAIKYRPIMERYAAELRPHMSGDIAFHTGQWVLFQPVREGGDGHAH